MNALIATNAFRSQIAAEVFAQLVDPIIDLVQQEMSRFRETYSEQKLEIKVL